MPDLILGIAPLRHFSRLPDKEGGNEHPDHDKDHSNKRPLHPLVDSSVSDPGNPLSFSRSC